MTMIHKGTRVIHAVTLGTGTVALDQSNGSVTVQQDGGGIAVWAVDDTTFLKLEPMPQDLDALPSIHLVVHKRMLDEYWRAKHLSVNWAGKNVTVTIVHADTWSPRDLTPTDWSPFMVGYPGLEMIPVTEGVHQFNWNDSACCWESSD